MTRGGMTLMETLIALALVVALGGVSLRLVSTVAGARTAAAQREASLWGAGVMMESVERDLLAAIAVAGPAVQGDATRVVVTSLRVDMESDPGEGLAWTTRHTIAFDAARNAITRAQYDAEPQVLVPGVRWFQVRYLVDGQWEAECAGEGALAAVELRVWFGQGVDLEPSEPSGPPDRRRLIPLLGADDAGEGGAL